MVHFLSYSVAKKKKVSFIQNLNKFLPSFHYKKVSDNILIKVFSATLNQRLRVYFKVENRKKEKRQRPGTLKN